MQRLLPFRWLWLRTIKITQQTIAFITGWEGFRADPFWDVHQWSYGYGTKARGEHETITQKQALNIMGIDLAKRAKKLAKQINFTPSVNQATALLSAAYNLGSVPNKVLAHCNNKAFDLAGVELRKYCHAGGEKLPALQRRREAEARLLEVDTMTRGEPRVQYNRVYHVLDQNASIEEFVAVARQAYEARETVGFSYDDAGIGDLEQRTVVLHGTHPENITDWFQEHYTGADVVQDQEQPPTPPQPPTEQTRALVGLHGSADGSWGNAVLDDTQRLIKTGKIEAYKGLSNESADSVKILKDINPDMFFCIRLMAKVNAEQPTASDFVQEVASHARSWWNQGVRYFEIHNEPNLRIEGMWECWKDGAEFASFWLQVKSYLQEDMPDSKWGFPGLSPTFQIDNVRYSPTRFFSEAWQAVDEADWIGAHCYWQNETELHSDDGGRWWERYKDTGKEILITEFSNPSPDVDKNIKGHQYVNYYKNLLNGAHSAYCFLSTASASFDHEVWKGSNIATIVGDRNG